MSPVQFRLQMTVGVIAVAVVVEAVAVARKEEGQKFYALLAAA